MGTKRILLAEDDGALCSLLEDALIREGFAVEVCADGLSALARIASTRPSIVVIDAALPPSGGTEIIEHLRSKGRLVPVILLATEHDEDLQKACEEWIHVGYLAKPFSVQEFLLAITRAGN